MDIAFDRIVKNVCCIMFFLYCFWRRVCKWIQQIYIINKNKSSSSTIETKQQRPLYREIDLLVKKIGEGGSESKANHLILAGMIAIGKTTSVNTLRVDYDWSSWPERFIGDVDWQVFYNSICTHSNRKYVMKTQEMIEESFLELPRINHKLGEKHVHERTYLDSLLFHECLVAWYDRRSNLTTYNLNKIVSKSKLIVRSTVNAHEPDSRVHVCILLTKNMRMLLDRFEKRMGNTNWHMPANFPNYMEFLNDMFNAHLGKLYERTFPEAKIVYAYIDDERV